MKSRIVDIFTNDFLLIFIIIQFFLAVFIIFRERKQTSATWSWIFVLTVIPVVGFFLYLLLGRGLSNTRLFDLKLQKEIASVETLRLEQEEFEKGGKIKGNTGTVNPSRLIHLLTTEQNVIYANEATLTLFTDGQSKFERLIEDIEEASDHIHFQYYIFRMDEIGKKVYQALVDALKRGVKVRVLLDAWGSNGIKVKDFKELTALGGKVVFFFPLHVPWMNPRTNYRNHRKIVVIDGKIGYTGGFNVGDEYLGKVASFGYWRDNHLRMTGEGVYSLQNRFIMDWNSQYVNGIKTLENYFPPIEQKGEKHLQVVTSGPDSEIELIKFTYFKMINMAKKEILIQTPYYIPDTSIHEALKVALMSGVRVVLQIPNKPDHMLVYWATYSFAAELIKFGAEIQTYERGFIHAKTVIIDGGICSVGSANMDNRSFRLDFEVNTIIYDEPFTREVRDAFIRDLEDCKPLTKEIYENRSRVIKVKESLSRLISPLL
ncbi:MAG: cardiolipin synthase [Streptococcaceae bacterium]|jgi:cardiolipin synthase|nr:cardiolipin synthase [Streptococcaceae bacterium]